MRELSGIRTFGDDVDPQAARQAIDDLREVAIEHGVVSPPRSAVDEEVRKRDASRLREQREADQAARKGREKRLSELRERYGELAAQTDGQQQRGLSLEPLIGDLLRLEEFEYHPPYRKGTVTQTDGFFSYDGFQYLIEARWRKDPPDVSALTRSPARSV